MKKVFLHVCCGICALASIQRLKEEGFYVEGFFFNPNIHPAREYDKRLRTALEVGKLLDVTIISGEYDPSYWFSQCQKYSQEQEGGDRCRICYQLRLERVFQLSQEKEFDYFTTTLTISPHKKSDLIFSAGKVIGGDLFLEIDFKKQNGFKKTVELAKRHNLYRQNYCGCCYSLNKIKMQISKCKMTNQNAKF